MAAKRSVISIILCENSAWSFLELAHLGTDSLVRFFFEIFGDRHGGVSLHSLESKSILALARHPPELLRLQGLLYSAF